MNPETAFGLILKKLRVENNFSQEKLAQLCNLDRTYISLLERGLRQPSLKTILILSKIFKLRASQLMILLEEKINEDNKN